MRRHAPEPRLVEGVKLVQQHRVFQVVVPKPERDQTKLARRIGKGSVYLAKAHIPS